MKRRYATLAEYLKKTRTSQIALARKLGVSKAYISMLVSGDRQPSLDVAVRIEELTGVPASALLSTATEASR